MQKVQDVYNAFKKTTPSGVDELKSLKMTHHAKRDAFQRTTALAVDIYNNRFNKTERNRKDKIWQLLCIYCFQKFISLEDIVLDLGAGNCEFINHIKCRKKIAIDMNPDTKKYANRDVEVLDLNPNSLGKMFPKKIDKVFVSNFFEHLSSKEELLDFMDAIYMILKPGGMVIVMSPNINLANGKYWDYIDHKLPLTASSIVEGLEISNFQIVEVVEKFLPFTTKNSLPVFSWMLYLYLKIPSWLRIGAGQSLIVAQKN
ncbi:MAG: methyltransferase domain-containing protein [Candidatus Daviesbacteria bacterium]|nr:methyltransferase domain-containing protein [Candidatus Daviesbacteria bacterium]